MKPYKFDFRCPQCDEGIAATYLPSTPDVFYLSNGDPGYPGDPEEAECQFESCPKCGHVITDEELCEQGRSKTEPPED